MNWIQRLFGKKKKKEESKPIPGRYTQGYISRKRIEDDGTIANSYPAYPYTDNYNTYSSSNNDDSRTPDTQFEGYQDGKTGGAGAGGSWDNDSNSSSSNDSGSSWGSSDHGSSSSDSSSYGSGSSYDGGSSDSGSSSFD